MNEPLSIDELVQEVEFNNFEPSKDLIINEVYEKQRVARVMVFGVQLDEMWSFVGKKSNKQWIWLALNPFNRQIVGMHIGKRGSADAQLFYEKIPKIFREQAGFFTDYWAAYRKTIDNPDAHFAVGKQSGLTAYIERFNCTLRQRVSRLVRKALSFSKSFENHIGAIKYFICHYNKNSTALHL